MPFFDNCSITDLTAGEAFSAGGYTPLTPNSEYCPFTAGNQLSSSYQDLGFDNIALNTTSPTSAPKRTFSPFTQPFSRSNDMSLDYNSLLSAKKYTSLHSSPLSEGSCKPNNSNGSSDSTSVHQLKSHDWNGYNQNLFSSRSNSPETYTSGQSNLDSPKILEMISLLSLAEANESQQQHQGMGIQQKTSLPSFLNENPKEALNNTSSQFGTLSSLSLELARLENLRTMATLKLLQAQSEQLPLLKNLLQGRNVNNMMPTSWRKPICDYSVSDTNLDNVANCYHSTSSSYAAPCTWSGYLPPRTHRMLNYSPKVFLGGIPWDINEQALIQIFKPFGQIRVDWPGKEQHAVQPKGFAYIIFESDKQVKALLSACILHMDETQTGGIYYYKISSRRIKAKDVEVKPWIIADSNYAKSASQKLDPTKTVFVGALHGKLTAEGLATIMNDLFDGVTFAGIDTDKYKYPIGSGRVTFNNNRSYMKAVAAAFIEVRTSIFIKKIQVNPYLEDSLCSICGVQHGPYFCRELSCFRYFCMSCWQCQHSLESVEYHKPLSRNSKSQTILGLSPSTYPANMPYNYSKHKPQHSLPNHAYTSQQAYNPTLFQYVI